MMTVAVTRLDVSAADLREAAARTQDACATRRMLAIALVLEGWSREAAAEACAMDRQTLRDWVHRYNESGLAGLFDRPRRNGPRPRLSDEQRAKVAAWVEQVPTLSGMASYVGAASICSSGSYRSSPSRCTSVRWASCCASCRSAGCRCVRSTRKARPRSKRFSARFCRPHDRGVAAGSCRQAGGGLV